MDDDLKARLGCLSAAFMLVLPVIALIIGFAGWGWRTGLVLGLFTFLIFFAGTCACFALIRKPTWFHITAPFFGAILYAGMPDFLLGPLDDAAVVAAGAIVSFALILRKYSNVPKWTLAPLLAAAVYTLIGEFLPGPVDEIIVGMLSFGAAAYGVYSSQPAIPRTPQRERSSAPGDDAIPVDAEVVDEDSSSQS